MTELLAQENPNDNLVEDNSLNYLNNNNDNNPNQDEEPRKVNSFSTILSIWNTMIGSSTVSLPYNVYNSGIIPAIFLSAIYGLICFYTCKVYIDLGSKHPDFAITIEKYFKKVLGDKVAKIGKFIQILFCILITLGGLLIYFLIINQNLYPISCLILNKMGLDIDGLNIEPAFNRFSIFYLGIILCIALFPLTIKKDIGFLVKFSSYGIYFISLLIIFVIGNGIASLINTSFSCDYIKNKPNSEKRHLKLFGENPALFAGTLSLGYFCHTAVLPILKSNKNQEHNTRDLFLGYCFVCLTFSLSGILGYIGFSGKEFDIDFKDNWFRFFDYDNYYILFFRLLNVIQLISVFPILVYVVRLQIFNSVYDNDYPSKKLVTIYGCSIMVICLLVLYFCYNFLGDLLGIIGATTSFFLIYTFPPVVKMLNRYLEIIGDKIDDEEEEENKCIVGDEIGGEDEKILKRIKREYNKANYKDILYFIGQGLFILVGIATVVFQFIQINFFGITLED